MHAIEGDAPAAPRVVVGQFSSPGRKPVNQDSMAARLPEGFEAAVKGIALAVADGISSSSSSQIAAETTVKALTADYYSTPEAWTVKTSARKVIEATNSWLYAQNRQARISDMNHGMVCTLSALILKGHEAHIFHVGDSRVSRLLGDSLEPLTEDHVAAVSATERHLVRAIGARHNVDIDYRRVTLAAGDVYVLSTDGVHEHIDGQVVRRALRSGGLDDAARAIAEEALDRGSTDNLTVQLLRVEALAEPALAPIDSALPLPQSLRPGDSLDGFRLLRDIHQTHRSRLLLALDAADNKVALKIPGVETGENTEYLQRFLYEEWVARRVDSPHIIKAAVADAPRSACYVAMQWIEGITLRQWMHDNPEPTLAAVRSIVEQIGRGLQALHRREMIHQDLRPENIMLNSAGTAIIIDLGSVSVAGLDESAPGLLGALPGTFQYTAPEYLSGDLVSWRSDQFSLGVIVYEMLTGRLPYGAQVARVRSRKDQKRLRYKPSDTGDSGVPAWIDFALARACHRDPMRRYDAMTEFLADLRRPSPGFVPKKAQPLIERNPLRFWQGVAFLQALALAYLLFRLL